MANTEPVATEPEPEPEPSPVVDAPEPEPDVPSSHDTSGQFPADDVRGDAPDTHGLDDDIPSSHDTCGQFPHDEVLATFEPEPPPIEG